MNLKHTVLTLSLLTATAIAASGCSRGVNVIDFAGQEMTTPSESVTPTDTAGNDTIVPENTGSPSTDTGTAGTTPDPETPTDTGPVPHEEKYCPAGTASEDGNGTLCCRIDNPQICMIIDPVPPGGVKPGILDHLPDDVLVVDPTPPPPPPGGTGGGSGGLDDPKDPDCYHKGPYGDRGMERMNNHSTTGDTGLGPVRGCVMM